MEDGFIKTMLQGIREWVNDKLALKQDTLTAGDNIEITSGGTISVTGITVPVVTDFDIKDLSDSTGLRDEWSGKQDALTAGDNITIDSAGTISATDTTYEASDFDVKDLADSTGLRDEWSGKQDALTAGANIEIDSSNTISVTGIVLPEPSDFDIKDLADSTGLRDEWSGKQDALTAGDNIEIDSAGTISVTGITSATEEELERMSLVISSNINELDGRLIAVENGKQDALTAGANIEIDSSNTISVTGIVLPEPSDFDIKDLADSTGLRNEWSGKQDALTEGSGIEIDSANTISVSQTVIDGAAAGATALQPSDIAEWAKAAEKPTYTAEEVGAMPADTVIIDDSEVTSGTTFSSNKIVELLGSISQFTVRVVQQLPASGETHVIYFVPAETGTTSGSDVMDEYMWIENKWEMIGNTRIDLSDYYTVTEVNALLDEKLDIPVISKQDVLDELNRED